MPDSTVGEAQHGSLADALDPSVFALPRWLGVAAILLVGWLVSSLLAVGLGALLRAVGFEDLARDSALGPFLRRWIAGTDATGAVTAVAKWLVRLIALVAALGLLGLPVVSGGVQHLLPWLPSLAVVLVVLVLGGLARSRGLAFSVGGGARLVGPLDRPGDQDSGTGERLERPAQPEEAEVALLAAGSRTGRVRRSGYDRRRIAREGADRRAAHGAPPGTGRYHPQPPV